MPVFDGYTHEPFFIEPCSFDIMVYPVEWIYDGMINEEAMQELLPMFYNRNWGRGMVACLPTLFHTVPLCEWFSEDPCNGLKMVMRTQPSIKVFPSDCTAMLQEGKLKFMEPKRSIELSAYIATPLIPSRLESPRINKMSLGLPLSPSQCLTEIRNMLS